MRLFWILPILAICACNTPQIPLPPPTVESFPVTVDAQAEQISFSGEVPVAGGEFVIVDPATGNGIIRRVAEDGSFETGLFDARDEQRFDMRYGDGHDSSDPLCVVVHYDPPGLQRCPN